MITGISIGSSMSCDAFSLKLTGARLGALLLSGDINVEAPREGRSDSGRDKDAIKDASLSSSTYANRLTELAIWPSPEGGLVSGDGSARRIRKNERCSSRCQYRGLSSWRSCAPQERKAVLAKLALLVSQSKKAILQSS